MEKITAKCHRVFKDANGIINVEIIDGVHIAIEQMRETGMVIRSLSEGGMGLVLVDARPHHTITDEAMAYLKDEMISKNRTATAVVTDKLGIKLMVDYFARLPGIKEKIKICTSKEEGLNWLLSIQSGGRSAAI